LVAAAVGVAALRNRRLLACVALAALAGPILVDALVDYFFAARQLLFAAPVLALCAAGGIERLRAGRRRWVGYALLLALCAAAGVSDYRLATVPRTTSERKPAVAAHLPADACVAFAPPSYGVYYLFLRPELERRICAEPPGGARVLAVMSPYSTPGGGRDQFSELFDESYAKAAVLQSGAGRLWTYRRR